MKLDYSILFNVRILSVTELVEAFFVSGNLV